jgi:hypothetical protein
MNILLVILYVILALVALFLLLALLAPKEYFINRQIVIHQSTQKVFSYLKHLKNQDLFSKWVMMDPNMKKSYSGTDGTVGFVYAWDGNQQAGKGEQEITSIEDQRKIDIDVRFILPFKGFAKTQFRTEPLSTDQTRVTWAMNSKMRYPMNIILMFINMDKMLGKDIETSLVTLKGNLER